MGNCCCGQWQILEDTSLPLSSSVPGVFVQPVFDDELTIDLAAAVRVPWSHRTAGRGGQAGQARAAVLTLTWRFYDFLPGGNSQFACLAYTMSGHRNVQYFTVHKN